MENLFQFRERTGSFTRNSLPDISEGFCTNPGLEKKVDQKGRLIHFYGDTIVFLLEEENKMYADKMRNLLYERCFEVFGDWLLKETFHVTLHDLSSGSSEQELQEKMEQNKKRSCEILRKIAQDPQKEIKMCTTYVFNMVNTSAVLGLEPADETSCKKLMEWYEMFHDVLPLPYALTPHITLGYYKPGKYHTETVRKLSDVFEEINNMPKMEIVLKTENLVYQRFWTMNCFRSVL